MVKHIWSVLCRESVINQENNSLSLMNIFEGLQIELRKDAPKDLEIGIPVSYEIVTFLRKDIKKEEDIKQRVSIIDPNGVVLQTPITVPIKMGKDKFNHRQRIKSMGFKVTKHGLYQFVVEIKQDKGDFEVVAMIPLEVTLTKQK